MSLVQTIVEKLENLPPEKQQEVLNFVELLHLQIAPDTDLSQEDETAESVLTKAAQFIGCVEGPADLSTNKNYLEGYGRS
ncbi:MAG: DUF2281 domain-containing protein [Limnospira sp. PMC 1291.21]|uniref:DUF2281 domain-containing protein n=3 Tax=Limnospira TaxID=2596745 RepID=A0A9P1KJY1_9CYAN|nr:MULTISPECIES: DUF2281 domain-containing protein [Limnospira]MDC0836126.1 DUF2281 domain-containing protein [Limnoraphis robusta]MDY7052342.1 DUF2281 domain-containing protein [Limnospira fusiformis LS22]QJB24816.1 DUF2281 domain-containing protein [Limnospira fusiformis SAG 85.79]RAQ40051.1 DUF2281 domain-containing protein [Arthrospira sp. O9.13F]UWU46432.1 Protein of unknown function (DUF2281) [Arthrospira platensis C1]